MTPTLVQLMAFPTPGGTEGHCLTYDADALIPHCPLSYKAISEPCSLDFCKTSKTFLTLDFHPLSLPAFDTISTLPHLVNFLVLGFWQPNHSVPPPAEHALALGPAL